MRRVERHGGEYRTGRRSDGLLSKSVRKRIVSPTFDLRFLVNDHDRAENDARRHPLTVLGTPNVGDTQLPLLSMNITSTLTSNLDDLMPPSEASGKRKASDDNSLNSNGAPKAKRTRNDVSAPILSVGR